MSCIKFLFLHLLMLTIVSCASADTKGLLNQNIENIKEDSKKIKSYGNNKEIQAYTLNGKNYYLLGLKDSASKLSESEIKKAIINTNSVKIKEATIEGSKGVIVTYYDIKLFLEENKAYGKSKVGIFELYNNSWVMGYNESKESNTIEIKNDGKIIGPIVINFGSISRAYN